MFVAGDLFARQGFHATTTRQIAVAVGIRQPSLFHHFPSKDAIAEALLEWDLGRAHPQVEAIASLPESAAVRLYRFLHDDVMHLSRTPFNLSGVYADEVIGRAEFARFDTWRNQLHDVVERIVQDGVASGEFVAVDTSLVRQAIAGILIRTLNLYSGGRGDGQAMAAEVSRLVVRGLMSEPTELDAVRIRATTVVIPGRAETDSSGSTGYETHPMPEPSRSKPWEPEPSTQRSQKATAARPRSGG